MKLRKCVRFGMIFVQFGTTVRSSLVTENSWRTTRIWFRWLYDRLVGEDLIDALATPQDVAICLHLQRSWSPPRRGSGQSMLKMGSLNSMFDVDGIAIFQNSPLIGSRLRVLQNDGELRYHLRTTHGSLTCLLNGFHHSWML